ncbi:MAG: hypothetical protein NTZ59_09830 [Bacteroidetes bacterium]|nr:hypothetical protein [Bacteroidota bacterium]
MKSPKPITLLTVFAFVPALGVILDQPALYLAAITVDSVAVPTLSPDKIIISKC